MLDCSLHAVMDGNIYVSTTGRRIYAFSATLEQARELGGKELLARLEQAIEHDKKTTLPLEESWARRTQKTMERPETLVADNRLDGAISGLFITADANTRLTSDPDLVQRATRFCRELFPEGVGAITSLPYAEELTAADRLVERIKNDFTKDMNVLGLARYVDEVGKCTKLLREAVNRARPEGVTFDQVRAAQAQGHENLLRVIAIVIGRFPGFEDRDVRTRALLLGPIMRQNEEIGAYFRSRRPVRDIDPKTGQELPVERPGEVVTG